VVRFFAAKSDISDTMIKLSAQDASHIRSLRLRPSELFIVCDGEGLDYICRLAATRAQETGDVFAEILEAGSSLGEPSVRCSVFIAFAKGDRLDYAVQKSVELGAHDIKLFPSERCVSVPGDISKKTDRLQKIAMETAKQCGRGIVPEITALDSFKSAVGLAVLADLPLFFYECEKKLGLGAALDQRTAYSTVSIFTGPEGGFEPHEAEFAQAEGMLAVSLGSRILRCETAPVAVLAAIMLHSGNLA